MLTADHSAYMLMVARDRWADYDRFRSPLAGLIAQGRTSADAQRLLDDFVASVEAAVSETWRYRADLSYVPEEQIDAIAAKGFTLTPDCLNRRDPELLRGWRGSVITCVSDGDAQAPPLRSVLH